MSKNKGQQEHKTSGQMVKWLNVAGGIKKCIIWGRFLTPVKCNALWFQNGAKKQNSDISLEQG